MAGLPSGLKLSDQEVLRSTHISVPLQIQEEREILNTNTCSYIRIQGILETRKGKNIGLLGDIPRVLRSEKK